MIIRNTGRHLLLLLAFSHALLIGNAQHNNTRIACIGNSITAGARVANPALHSYPAVLSAMLHGNGYAGYTVRNFGVGGATIIRFGTPNLWGVLDSLATYSPDVAIIEAGTNETVGTPRYNWDHIGDFEKDCHNYIAAIRGINPACRIIICSPLDMVLETDSLSAERRNDLAQRRPRVWELRKRMQQLAKAEQVYFLDLTNPFKGKKDLMTIRDGVHPNQAGYQYLAELVYAFLVKKKIAVQ